MPKNLTGITKNNASALIAERKKLLQDFKDAHNGQKWVTGKQKAKAAESVGGGVFDEKPPTPKRLALLKQSLGTLTEANTPKTCKMASDQIAALLAEKDKKPTGRTLATRNQISFIMRCMPHLFDNDNPLTINSFTFEQARTLISNYLASKKKWVPKNLNEPEDDPHTPPGRGKHAEDDADAGF